MKILYLSYFATPKLFDAISVKDKSSSIAAHKFEQQLLNELSQYSDIDLNVLSNITDIWEGEGAVLSDSYRGVGITYVPTKRNSVLSMLRGFICARRKIKQWLRSVKTDEAVILSYAVNPVLMTALFSLHSKIKKCTICSEVPQFRVNKGNKLKGDIIRRLMRHYNEKMDGYIFFSKYMNDVCNKKNKPWIVVEGMPDIRPINDRQFKAKDCETILYAGYLVEKNGTMQLLEAFKKIKRENIKLIICGSGALSGAVEQAAENDKRIDYRGFVNNEVVLEIEKDATLLISPRIETNELTKYSFPSKVFEYLSSGTAACISRLQGIPDEYYPLCYVIRCDSADSLAEDIEKVLDIPQLQRHELALGAYEFLKKEKSSVKQCAKVVEFLKTL